MDNDDEKEILLNDENNLSNELETRRIKSQLFVIVKNKSLEELKQFVEDHGNHLINIENSVGFTPLSVAVLQNSLPKVIFLLENGANINDAHLLAINNGHFDIMLYLLDLISEKYGFENEYLGVANSNAFAPYVTPLMLAAQKNDYTMLQALKERGHPKINKPANYFKEVKGNIPYYHGYRRYVFSSLASPFYICLTEEDPFEAAFKLGVDLKRESEMDKEYSEVYHQLIKRLQKFTGDLISECRDLEETSIILNEPGLSELGSSIILPRLQWAIELKEKDFVAAPSVQCYLVNKYYGHRYDWNWKSFHMKLINYLMHLCFLLPVSLIRMVNPKNNFVKMYTTPQSTFIFHFTSLLIFDGLLLCLLYLDLKRTHQGPPETGLESIIIIFVLGFIGSTLKKGWTIGLNRLFRHLWWFYELSFELLFLTSFYFWYRSYSQAKLSSIGAPWNKKQTRFQWSPNNPTLLHESCFAIATFLAVFYLLYYTKISPTLGPWQASIKKMMHQIYLSLFFSVVIFLIPLSLIMTSLYHNYNDPGNPFQANRFTTLSKSATTLFWAMLSQMNPDVADIGMNYNFTSEHIYTKWTGYAFYMFFCISTQIALVNALIAIITNTFKSTLDNADKEWKFARAQIMIQHCQEASKMPPPFNLLIGIGEIRSLIKWFRMFIGIHEKIQIKVSATGFKYSTRSRLRRLAKEDYKQCVKDLVRRYIQSIRKQEYARMIQTK